MLMSNDYEIVYLVSVMFNLYTFFFTAMNYDGQ